MWVGVFDACVEVGVLYVFWIEMFVFLCEKVYEIKHVESDALKHMYVRNITCVCEVVGDSPCMCEW